jgi:putative nucleotidyltransferase with HDIG domain
MQTESLREQLLSRAETSKTLPTLSTIISELLRVMSDVNSSFGQLFDVIRYDQSISSKLISIANSAYYSRGTRVVSLQRAMMVVGYDEIKNIVMCLAFLKEILHLWKLSQKDLAVIWTHSLGVGYAAKTLSSHLMIEEPEKVFTVSILHDIGKIIFYSCGDQYRQIVEEARQSRRDLFVLEKETFGIDHQEVGYYMAVKWRFPEEFSEVIRNHHERSNGMGRLADLVRIADRFIDDPKADLGAEGIILQREKVKIMEDTKRISSLLGVTDAGE